MLAARSSEQFRVRLFTRCRQYLSTQTKHATNDSEYSEEAEYPKILDNSFEAKKEQSYKAWHEAIRKCKTVEEKLIKINMPRYWGYKVIDLNDEKLVYNSLPALQHYTRTVMEELPSMNKSITEDRAKHLDSFIEALRSDVISGLEFCCHIFRYKYPNESELEPMEKEKILSQLIVEELNRCMINGLSEDYNHLKDVDIDYNPRHEAFWFVGGINPPKNVQKSKEGQTWQKEMAKDPIDRPMQYTGKPYLALRNQNQLSPWKSEKQSENFELAKQIPRYNYDPRTLGYATNYQHGVNVPGYWPTARINFGLLSYQSRAPLLLKTAGYKDEDVKAWLDAQAIQSSYAWLLAQANYNGFNTFNEITYPMNTQTIITNGRLWSFYEYQLNTLLVHTRHIDENPRVNFCRGTYEMKLFDLFDDKGKCVGFNDEVLKQIVQFYINVPNVKRTLDELQPYLHPEVKRIADYSNVEQREFLERKFKHMCSNRPRHLAKPEIYLWEKFYKIDNNTRPMEARRRFFELSINPWKRTLDQHAKEYIPRVVRPDGPKSKKKFKPMYYP